MGIMDTIFGRKKILEYEIVFDSNNNVGVNLFTLVPDIPGPDYIRLWASYQAKLIYNLGFPKNLSAMLALGSVGKVAERKINAKTNCFKLAKIDDVVTYKTDAPANGIKFTGEFYAKGSLDRMIQTHFPHNGTEQQLVFSGLALMQYAININSKDKEVLEVFNNTAANFVKLYQGGMGEGISAISEIPKYAYMKAIGLM